jgi:hypothetical protein
MRVVPVKVAVVAHLVDDLVQRQRLIAEQERAAGDRRDQRDLVAVLQLELARRVLLVDGIEQAVGLVPEIERPPHVGHGLGINFACRPARAFAQPCKETHAHGHRPSILRCDGDHG